MNRYFLLLIFLISISFSLHAQYAKPGDIKITEIMYNPPEKGTDVYEYIEFYNTTSSDIDLGGYILAKLKYVIPAGIKVSANGYIFFCKDSLKLDSITGHKAHGWQWKTGTLGNSGDTVGLRDPKGNIIDTIYYKTTNPWPKTPNGYGPSLTLCNETSDEHNRSNWSAANEYIATVNGYPMQGTPGGPCTGPSFGPDSTPPKPVSATVLTSTQIQIVFDEAVGSSADSAAHYSGLSGITMIKRNALMDTVTLTLSPALKNGKSYFISISGIRDTAGNKMRMPVKLKILYNSITKGLVITEIMYNNPGADNLEYIEIYNSTTDTLSLGGLKVATAINFAFPETDLLPGHYFLIARDSVLFDSFFKISAYPWVKGGSLLNTSETILIENSIGGIIDSVRYSSKSPWPTKANGGGPSMVLCNAFLDNTNPTNWSASTDYVDSLNGYKVFGSPGSKCSSASGPVHSLPADRSICKPIILDAGNAGSEFRWSNGRSSQFDTITSEGKYKVLVVNGAGAAWDSITLYRLKALPDVKDSICVNTPVQFTDSSTRTTSSRWYFGDGDSTDVKNPSHTYLAGGKMHITLKIRDSYCTDTAEKNIIVQLCTGIEEEKRRNAINIFPNPSDGKFNLTGNFKTPVRIYIRDIAGRVIYHEDNFTNSLSQVRLPVNCKGIFLLTIQSGEEIEIRKLVVY